MSDRSDRSDRGERVSFRDIQDYVDESIKRSEEKMRGELRNAISDLRRELRGEVSAKIDAKVAERVDTLNAKIEKLAIAKQSTALIPAETRNQLTTEVRKDVLREVYGFIEKNVTPRIDAAIAAVEYNTQDGGELVTAYRRDLHEVVNKPNDPNTRLITGRTETKGEAFSRGAFFFHEGD